MKAPDAVAQDSDLRAWMGRTRATRWALCPWFPTVLRLLLGGIFVFAAVAKLREPVLFSRAIGGFKLLHESILLYTALVFIWLELVSGTLLILGLWVRGASLVACALLGVFFMVMVSALARGLDVECGCFGALLPEGVGPSALLRTGLFELMGLTVLFLSAASRPASRKSRRLPFFQA